MYSNAPFFARAAAALSAVLLGVILGAGIALPDGAAASTDAGESVQEWLAQMAEHYERNPELKETGGSGWKPYNRAKWFVEQRLASGAMPAPGARWEASQERLRREQEAGGPPRTSWFSTGPMTLSGRILDIEFHPTNPDIVYVGSASGGLWKSIDNGLTWSTSTDQLPVLAVGGVAVLPSNPDIVLIGTGEGNGAGVWGVGLLKSTDGGETWSETSLDYEVTQSHGFNAIEVNPATGTILAAARDGLWRSTDDGDNWTQIETGRWYDVKWQPESPLRVYAAKASPSGSGNGVKVSTDDGLTFVHAGTGQPGGNLIGKTKITVTPADPDVIYSNYVNRSTNETLGIYRSNDAGATWTEVFSDYNMTGGQGWYNLSLVADPNDVNRLVAGGVRLYQSDDGGANWTITGGGHILGDSTAVHVDHHAAAYEPGSDSNVWVGSDGGVWRSTDDGRNWITRREGLVTYQFYDIAVAQTDPVFMMGGTQDNGIPGRTGTTTWFPSTLLADGMVCNVTPDNADIVYGEWQFGNHVKSFNGGVNWHNIMHGITGSGAWVTPVDQDQNNPQILFTSTSHGVFRTTIGGSLWENVSGHFANWISISRANGDVVWTLYTVAAWLSTDGGDTWGPSSSWGFPALAATKILTHPHDENFALVTFSGYNEGYAHVALTTDQGVSWQDVSGDLPIQPVNAVAIDPANPSAWFIGTDTGVWWTTNGGINWLPYETGLPHVVVTDLEINGLARKLVAGTYGRGAWEINLPDLTGAGDPLSVSSLRLMLDPPYPNPASELTTLRFAARDLRSARLDIYDVRGRLVEHVAETRGDGIIRSVSWSPGELPSGAYFAVLRAGDESVSQKLIVRK